MTRSRRQLLSVLMTSLLWPAWAQAQSAATYPSEAVKMVVPYAAGGATDIVARAVAEKMASVWSKPIIIDNKPGAGTTLAAAQFARMPGDGHSLYMTTSAHTISASMYKKLDYDPVKDFAPLTLVARVPLVLVVRPDLKVKSLAEFVQYVQANPDKVSYASPGNGTAQHLAGEMFNTVLKSRVVHVPYKGDAPAITDLMGGTVDAMFATLTVVIPHIESGKLKALALANGTRVEKVPAIPTFAEAGMSNFEFATWFGVFAPASTPRSLREKISEDIRSVVLKPELRKSLVEMGGEVVGSRPAEFEAFVQSESKKWQEAVRASGAQVN